MQGYRAIRAAICEEAFFQADGLRRGERDIAFENEGIARVEGDAAELPLGDLIRADLCYAEFQASAGDARPQTGWQRGGLRMLGDGEKARCGLKTIGVHHLVRLQADREAAARCFRPAGGGHHLAIRVDRLLRGERDGAASTFHRDQRAFGGAGSAAEESIGGHHAVRRRTAGGQQVCPLIDDDKSG